MAGCGTVGSGVAELLLGDRDRLRARTGFELRLSRVAVRDPGRTRRYALPDQLLTSDMASLYRDEVDIVVEVIGGTDVARDVVLAAIAAGKDVVTANKALIALHGPEIFAAARARGVGVAFEASCLAGMPVIGMIQRGLVANRIDRIEGIFNGTCNFILTEMQEKGRSFADALGDAQRLGYAEADPTLDISGADAAHKLAILGSLAFGSWIDFSTVSVQGIEGIGALGRPTPPRWGTKGYVCRLLATATATEGNLSLAVYPEMLPETHPLAMVRGTANALTVHGHAVGTMTMIGQGAGGLQTASGIVSDVVECALGNARRTFARLPIFNAAPC
jgi:homoserine dehydrogenase